MPDHIISAGTQVVLGQEFLDERRPLAEDPDRTAVNELLVRLRLSDRG